MYYYSNGRPRNEINLGPHSTIFRKRPNTNDLDGNLEYKKLFGKIYIKKKTRLSKNTKMNSYEEVSIVIVSYRSKKK